MTAQRTSTPPRLLVVDDDARYGQWLGHHLGVFCPDSTVTVLDSAGFERWCETDTGQDCDILLLTACFGSSPEDPKARGLELLRQLRARPVFPAVIALADEGNELTAVRALHLGAVDYLPKRLLTPERLSTSIRLALRRVDKRVQRKLAALAQAADSAPPQHQTKLDGAAAAETWASMTIMPGLGPKPLASKGTKAEPGNADTASEPGEVAAPGASRASTPSEAPHASTSLSAGVAAHVTATPASAALAWQAAATPASAAAASQVAATPAAVSASQAAATPASAAAASQVAATPAAASAWQAAAIPASAAAASEVAATPGPAAAASQVAATSGSAAAASQVAATPGSAAAASQAATTPAAAASATSAKRTDSGSPVVSTADDGVAAATLLMAPGQLEAILNSASAAAMGVDETLPRSRDTTPRSKARDGDTDASSTSPNYNSRSSKAASASKRHSTPPPPPVTAEFIPGYIIKMKIGESEKAVVYLAHSISLGTNVALKVSKTLRDDAAGRQFLEREYTAIIAIRDPLVVQIYDYGVHAGFEYLAMEYLVRGDLKARLQTGLKEIEALRYVEQIAAALRVVHNAGLLHRDLKPPNVMLRENDEVALIDFGLARALDGSTPSTRTGVLRGSPYYMSPEQAQGDQLDVRSDFYSLGIMFYEMLTGRKPYTGATAMEVLQQHVSSPLPPLPHSLARYEQLLHKMAAKNRNDRFTKAEEIIAAVAELRATMPAEVQSAVA